MNQSKSHNSYEPEHDATTDEFCRAVLRAGAANEAVIAAAAETPFLHQRIRARITANESSRAHRFRLSWLAGWSWSRAVATASALALLVAAAPAAWNWIHTPRETGIQQVFPTPNPSRDLTIVPLPAPNPAAGARRASAVRKAAARRIAPAEEPEQMTAFVPLTVVANEDEQASGQIVRVEAPRSALLALGLPVQGDRAGDVVKADVLIGDDGLARAIRFVR
jgi:hypothetical protein